MSKLLFACSMMILAAAAGCQTVGTSVRGIANFAEVEHEPSPLYRGAQPSTEGMKTLARKGVRTVIDLRDDAVPQEQNLLAHEGIKYVQIPTNAGIIRPRQVQTFLEKMRSEERPIFVHCRMGRDRTGLEIAVYRIVEDGWDRDAAIRELYDHGYNWMLYPGIERYLRTFDPSQFGARGANTGRSPAPHVENHFPGTSS